MGVKGAMTAPVKIGSVAITVVSGKTQMRSSSLKKPKTTIVQRVEMSQDCKYGVVVGPDLMCFKVDPVTKEPLSQPSYYDPWAYTDPDKEAAFIMNSTEWNIVIVNKLLYQGILEVEKLGTDG